MKIEFFGKNDLGKDLRLPFPNRNGLLYSMQKCILAARATEKVCIDGVFMNINDDNGLREDTEFGHSLGFDGKTLIHPNRINIVNDIYTPSETAISAAKRIINAFQDAQKEGKSVATLDGVLIEYLHVKQAQELLEMYEQTLKK